MRFTKEAEMIRDKIPDIRLIYCVLNGLTYRQIGIKLYFYNENKVKYRIRQLFKMFNLANRRHLAYFAVVNNIIDMDLLEKYKDV